MKKKQKNLPYKRKRQGKTDYKTRIRLLASKKPRLVVRKSLKNIITQIIEFHPDGDKILVSANTNELSKKYGWKGARRNTSASYLTGLLAGVKAKEKKITQAILDIGLQKSSKGSIIFAALKGAIDSGLNIPHSKEKFPSEERISGKHLKTKDISFDKIKETILKNAGQGAIKKK